ncbi:MAG: hypothetical protein SFU98_18085 [Leptospiraceae bacterium]|nr:hypothetical protein [Leptospiraceae bacterium]
MSYEIQNYTVYAIVLFALYKLTFPLFEIIFQKLKSLYSSEKPPEDEFSCYSGTCAKCRTK